MFCWNMRNGAARGPSRRTPSRLCAIRDSGPAGGGVVFFLSLVEQEGAALDIKQSAISITARVATPEVEAEQAPVAGRHPATHAQVQNAPEARLDAALFMEQDFSTPRTAFADQLAQTRAAPLPLASRKAARPGGAKRRSGDVERKKAKRRENEKRAKLRAMKRAPVVVATPTRAGSAVRAAVVLQVDGDGRLLSSSARDSIVSAAIKELQKSSHSEGEAQALAAQVVASLIQQHLQGGGVG